MCNRDPVIGANQVRIEYNNGAVGFIPREAVARLNRLAHDRGYTVAQTLELLLLASSWLVEMKD